MSDLVERSKRLIARSGVASRVGEVGRESDAVARVRALLARERERTGAVPPRPAASTNTGTIRVPMTCGVVGTSFTGLAVARADDVLMLVGYELPESGSAGLAGAAAPASLPGRYRFEAIEGWACPLCRARENAQLGTYLVWQCRCRGPGGSLQCAGSIGKRAYCGCGVLIERNLGAYDSFVVKGEPCRPPAAANLASSPSTRKEAPALPRQAATAPPRLTGRRSS